ncbi:MAG TPA: hypothetical protein VEJ18_07395, partial [Planctomycetota bacterium]|nr:hypothetical protein [Planctomycetota bacterium]
WERWELVFAATRGSNYGWSIVEGPSSVHPNDAAGPSPILPATHLIPHPEAASISGGFVYRGNRIPSLRGHLLYGDWETRRIWANPVKGATLGERREIARTPLRIVGFAEDAKREHVVLDHEGGGVWALVPNTAAPANAAFPRALSATGLFTSTPDQAPAAGVLPYRPNAPRWADGATAQRWIAMPGLESPKLIDKNRAWPRESIWPKDTVFAKTLSLEGRKVETQVLHYDGQEWAAYAYLWNKEQTDATLVPAEGTEADLGGGRRWRVYGRAACLTCHNPWPGRILTFNAMQLTRPGPDDPMKAFQELGFLPREVPRAKEPLVDPYDESAPLDARARSYLAVNCAHCHRFGGGGSALIDLRAEIPLKDLKAHQVRPGLGGFDLPDPYILAGGDPSRSVLFYRVAKLGRGRMPHLGSEAVDERGVDLLARWIASLPSEPTTAATRAADAAAVKALREGDRTALDRLLAAPAPALDLLRALPELPEALRNEAVRRALALPSGPVRDLFERFEDPAKRRKRLGPSPAPAEILALSGDPGRGRALFEGTAVQCKACHRLDRPDDMLGPDLSKIGAKYTRPQLLDSILDPSKQIDPKYALYVVQTTDDSVVSGRLVAKSDAETVLRDAQAGEIRLQASRIRRMIPQSKSAMPEYLLQDLTAQEAADLIAFLASLK